ncbi:major facilitator superfamily protein [Apiospora arundinis]
MSKAMSTKSDRLTFNISDRAKLRSTLLQATNEPVLIHLNADTTWLVSLPYPPTATKKPVAAAVANSRSRFNILLDPWLEGPQSDVASWFSTQWHLVAPSVQTIDELNILLIEVEQGEEVAKEAKTQQQTDTSKPASLIDVVAISHEFTDHCHEATLKELPRETPVFATEKAAELIRTWRHFDSVITTPGFSSDTGDWQKTLSVSPLPDWVGIGRVITAGNALYYHSAVMIAFKTVTPASNREDDDQSSNTADAAAAVVYSPHGIKASDLASVKSAGIETRALLHGLHDVRIWMTKQLNLGALNGLEAVRASGAKYWIATHDEVKKGGGFIAPLLRRTQYTVADAVQSETKNMGDKAPDYEFIELNSGDALVLA